MSDQSGDLAAIRRLMDDAQRTVEDNGKYFVAWGVLTIAGLVATYFTVTRQGPMTTLWITWAALIACGWLVGFWWGRQDRLRSAASTVASSMVSDIWAGVGVALTILVFAGAASGAIAASAVSGIVAALFGVGSFASSSVYRQLPLRAAAFLWWAGALAMLVRPGVYGILLLAALVLLLFVAPGVVLWMRARASQTQAK